MSNQADISANRPRDGAFGVVMRGYDRREVDEFVARSRHQVRDLGERLARALNDVEASRAEVDELRIQLATNRPVHEELSERLAAILRLADEEAAQKRALADDTVTQIRAIAEQDAQRLVGEAGEEAQRTITLAREEAERIITAAQERADREVAAARDEAERALTSSRGEAERTLTSAQERASYLLGDAERRAAAVNLGAGQRLESMTQTHTDTVGRLSEIHGLLSGVLADESRQGSLADDVEALIDSGEPLPVDPDAVDEDEFGAAVPDGASARDVPPEPEAIDEAAPEESQQESPQEAAQEAVQEELPEPDADGKRTIDLTDDRQDSPVTGSQR
jgi:cell division septum initiation protein DivIVA